MHDGLKRTSLGWMAVFKMSAVLLASAPLLCADDAEVRIAKFPGDRPAAVSFTFDDGLPDHLSIAVPALEKRGMRGTFFLVAGNISDSVDDGAKLHPHGKIPWPVWKEIAENGHEIGNHSMHHKQLTKLSDEELAKEIDDAYHLIEEKIGQPPLTFCFPGNGHDERVDRAVARQHIAGRNRLVGYGAKEFTLDKRYKVPLTVVIPAPDAKEAKAVRQEDGKKLSTKIAHASILVDIPPDGKPVDITW